MSQTPAQTNGLKKEYLELLQELEKRVKYNYISTVFPEQGLFSRDKYPKHMEFFAAGAKHSQRIFIAANRVGKSFAGMFEVVVHATGNYPEWWTGRRFNRPIKAWVASISSQTLKEIVVETLFGSAMKDSPDFGTGLVPKEALLDDDGNPMIWAMPGAQTGTPASCRIRHVSGGFSDIGFKVYEQGPDKFQGTKRDVILLDEEPSDHKVYTECITRLADPHGDNGILLMTFTPLKGMTDTVLSFMPGGLLPLNGSHPEAPARYAVQATWDDVPHLSEDWKKETLASYPPHERAARSKGVPYLGSGSIYPYPEDMIKVEPFKIPAWWPRAYGLDPGWNRTAAIWGATDPATNTTYLYSEYYGAQAVPAVHATAIKQRGDWIWGAIDPASAGAGQADGKRLIDFYEEQGLSLTFADNTVEAGISTIQQALETGRLKIFSHLQNFFNEYRLYRRDDNGKVVKEKDHLMDATRYLIMSGLDLATTAPDEDDEQHYTKSLGKRDRVTGY